MLLEALAAATVAQAPIILTHIDWVRIPTGEDLADYYPEVARAREISGRVTMVCLLTPQGRLEPCAVRYEDPPGLHFGDAALKLAAKFLARVPSDRQGDAKYAVRVPIHFVVPRLDGTYSGTNTVAKPLWLRAPTYQQALAAFPVGVGAGEAKFVFDCEAGQDGSLGKCRTLVSEPRGGQFEGAARSLLPLFRLTMDPTWDPHRRPIRVNVPIRLVDPASAEGASRRLRSPPWIAMPAAEILANAFPTGAKAQGLTSGRGVIQCEVADDGSLAKCGAVSATPAGAGFEDAALRVAKDMRMNLWTPQGGPVIGARLQLPIRFEQPVAAATSSPQP